MPTKNPRIHVVLEKPLYKRLRGLARRDGLSMSLEARELIRIGMTGERPDRKIYTGRHFGSLVGAFRSKIQGNLDDTLADQVHG
jgi:hypothetical protein